MVTPVDRTNFPVTREHDPLARVRMQQFLEQLPRQVSTTNQQPLQNNNASAIRSQFRPDAFQRSEVGGYPGGIPSQKAPYFVSVDRNSDRNQIPMTRYPNYRDKRVVDEAIAMGKDTALDVNQEAKKEGFIASLLGDIDFKSLAKSPLVMQALQGLSRMPTNQAQFGDSMVTGFTRGMQQFGAEEQAKAKEQAAIDLEQSRYDAQQAASAASTAESLRRFQERIGLEKESNIIQAENNRIRARERFVARNLVNTPTKTKSFEKNIEILIEDDPDVKNLVSQLTGFADTGIGGKRLSTVKDELPAQAIVEYNDALQKGSDISIKDSVIKVLTGVIPKEKVSGQDNFSSPTSINFIETNDNTSTSE